MKNSVLLIGVDGAPWHLLKPWLDGGKLPNLRKYIGAGVAGNLKSTIPLESGSTWVSLSTGKNPGKHGIYRFITRGGKLIDSSSVKSERIWHALSRYNRRCGIINIPVTYPVEEINGCMVSSFLTPPNEKIYSYPNGLMNVLNKYGYKIDIKYEKYAFIPDPTHFDEKREFYLKEFYDILEKRYLTLKEIMNEEWDLFMINFKECDSIMHYFWDKNKVMLEYFEKVDLYVGELIKIFSTKNPNPYIFVVSDHGFNAAPVRAFNIRAWMDKEGIMKDDRNLIQKVVPKIYNVVSKVPLSKLLFKSSKSQEIRERFQIGLAESSSIFYRNGIFINKDKFTEEEYENIRNELVTNLKMVKDPSTHERVFQIVQKREEMYSGNYAGLAPDIATLSYHNYDVVFTFDTNELFYDSKISIPGKHISELYGIVVVTGADIKQGKIINASITDICPIILHILGVPIPPGIDGKVLKEIFKEDSELNKKEIEFEKSFKRYSEIEKIKESVGRIKI